MNIPILKATYAKDFSSRYFYTNDRKANKKMKKAFKSQPP